MRTARAVAVGLLVAILWAAPGAATAADVPSVGLRPTQQGAGAPNHGQWFVAEVRRGGSATLRATVSNSADVEQRVSLYLTDLRLQADGTPQLGARDAGVGAWGRFAQPSLVVPAKAERTVAFTVTVPADADPGDHLGAVVAEGAPTGAGDVGVIKRVASRLYVTVPGRARAGLAVVSAKVTPERTVAPRWATVSVVLRNTGDVRLVPTVKVGGTTATGARLVMSQSVESFEARVRLPLLGGRASFHVVARGVAASGASVTRRADPHTFVLPFAPLLFLVLLALGVASTRRILRAMRPTTVPAAS